MDIRRLRVDALQEYAAKGPAERKQVEAELKRRHEKRLVQRLYKVLGPEQDAA
jgi:hypothetical protein